MFVMDFFTKMTIAQTINIFFISKKNFEFILSFHVSNNTYVSSGLSSIRISPMFSWIVNNDIDSCLSMFEPSISITFIYYKLFFIIFFYFCSI